MGQTIWQATQWPGATSRHSGTFSAQIFSASQQRVRKRQPEGGFAGLGTSPSRIIRFRFSSTRGSATGTAESSAWV